MPFALALGAAVVLTPLLRRLGLAIGVVDRPGDPLRIHREEVPLLGGIGVMVATLGAVALV
jgi:UDP-GlcNAc:undecaprenyl-phosphate/decaprenyl-phosphate GlcNAc-1-phosphate transferase